MTRQEIRDAIRAKKQAIKALNEEIIDLQRADHLLCDEGQWFTEKVETVTVRESGKRVKRNVLIGRIHWNEVFRDEDTGEGITIERSSLVRVDGKWDW